MKNYLIRVNERSMDTVLTYLKYHGIHTHVFKQEGWTNADVLIMVSGSGEQFSEFDNYLKLRGLASRDFREESSIQLFELGKDIYEKR